MCYALTAHKVQGQTLNKVAINISKDAFAHGSFYVALSNVKKLHKVVLFGPEQFPVEGLQFHNNGVIQTIMNVFLLRFLSLKIVIESIIKKKHYTYSGNELIVFSKSF